MAGFSCTKATVPRQNRRPNEESVGETGEGTRELKHLESRNPSPRAPSPSGLTRPIRSKIHKLGRGSRDKVQQFMDITGASEKVALQALKASDWHLEGAFDIFYSQPQVAVANTWHLEEVYNRYKEPNADMIMVEGISQLCNDLQVDPQDIVMEFIGGLQSIGVDSMEKLREKLPSLRAELKDHQKFREIYNFAFAWAREKGQKSLALEIAVGMWWLLFAERNWPLIDHWCQFLQVRHNRAISGDTWVQLLEFVKTVDPQLTNYDEEGAWPYLIDEFVDYLKENGVVQHRQ